MYKLLIAEDFYEKLTPNFKKQCITLCKSKRNKDVYNKLSLFLLLITGAFFIIVFKDILFTNKSNLSLNNIFYYIKCLIYVLGGFLISSSLGKNSNKKYDKIYDTLKTSLLSDICTCKDKCTCKNDLKIFFKNQGISL